MECRATDTAAMPTPPAITQGRCVHFGGRTTVEVDVEAGVALGWRRVSESRSPLRDCDGKRWHEDAESLRKWAYSAHADAAAIRSAAELRFDIWESDGSLGCCWPVLWTAETASVLIGSPNGRPAKQPHMVFGGSPHNEVQTRDDAIDAIERLKKAHNVLYLGDVPPELHRPGHAEWHHGNHIRVACPATRRSRQPVRAWLMDTACGHDLISDSVVETKGCDVLPVSSPLTFNTAGGPSTTRTCVEVDVEELGSTAYPYAIQSTPAVLSICWARPG